jgi:hypothetical protein
MAIAVDIISFFALIVLGVLMAFATEPASLPLIDAAAKHTSTQAATDGQEYVRATWDVLNLLIVLFGSIGLVVTAVARRRRV